MHLRLALIAPLLVAAMRSCSQPAPLEAASAEAFRASVGVNLHLEYEGTAYDDVEAVERALSLLHVDHVRDAAFRDDARHMAAFQHLASRGVRFNLFFNRDIDRQVTQARHLQAFRPSAISTLEGPNEVNNEAFDRGAAGDTGAAKAYQRRLRDRLRREPALHAAPLLAFTTWPPTPTVADAANFHSYPAPHQPPARRLAWERRLSAATQPDGVPIFCTETGYTTAGAGSVTEARQAVLVPILLLENHRARVARTFLYELFDGAQPGGSADPQNGFGLFHFDRTPKPAAVALGRLMRLVDDRDVDQVATPSMPAAHISGNGLRRLDLTRRDGVRLTVVWPAEPQRLERLEVRIRRRSDMWVLDLASGHLARAPADGRTLRLGPGASVIFTAPNLAEHQPAAAFPTR